MAYFAHAARMDTMVTGMTKPMPQSEHLAQTARRVREKHGPDSVQYKAACAELDGPPCPAALEYLREWSDELLRGPDSLGWEALDAWARRTGNTPTRQDCLALMRLDDVRRHPPLED
jgi:hypothetical protein